MQGGGGGVRGVIKGNCDGGSGWMVVGGGDGGVYYMTHTRTHSMSYTEQSF